MKPAIPPRGLLSRLSSSFAMLSLGIASVGLPGQALAEAVDSELLLLVDVSQPGLNPPEFSSLMESYASAFTSAQVLNSIQSGTYGRIAVSLMFYGNSSMQQMGVNWMSIGNASDAAAFSSSVSLLARPNSSGSSNIATALAAATAAFGSETGGLSNGFESTVQVIDVAASTMPGTGGQAARNAAMLSGVDLINAIALGKANKTGAIESYFATNIIGSSLGGVAATSTSSTLNNALTAALIAEINGNVNAGIAAVPEPSSAFGLITGFGFVLLLRRRA